MLSRQNFGAHHPRINHFGGETIENSCRPRSDENLTRPGRQSTPVAMKLGRHDSIRFNGVPGSPSPPRQFFPAGQRPKDLAETRCPRTLLDVLNESLNACDQRRTDEKKMLLDAELLELKTLQKALKESKKGQKQDMSDNATISVLAALTAAAKEQLGLESADMLIGGQAAVDRPDQRSPRPNRLPDGPELARNWRDGSATDNNNYHPVKPVTLRRRQPHPDAAVRPPPTVGRPAAAQPFEVPFRPIDPPDRREGGTVCHSAFRNFEETNGTGGTVVKSQLVSKANGAKDYYYYSPLDVSTNTTNQRCGPQCCPAKSCDQREADNAVTASSPTGTSCTGNSRPESPDTIRDRMLIQELRDMALMRELQDLMKAIAGNEETTSSSSEDKIQNESARSPNRQTRSRRTKTCAGKAGEGEVEELEDAVEKRIGILEERFRYFVRDGHREADTMIDETTQTEHSPRRAKPDDRTAGSFDSENADRHGKDPEKRGKCEERGAHVCDSSITQVSSVWLSASECTDATDAAAASASGDHPHPSCNVDQLSLVNTISSELLSASMSSERLRAAIAATTGGRPLDENSVLAAIERELADVHRLLNGTVHFFDVKPAEFLQMHVRKLHRFTMGLDEFLQEQKTLACTQ